MSNFSSLIVEADSSYLTTAEMMLFMPEAEKQVSLTQHSVLTPAFERALCVEMKSMCTSLQSWVLLERHYWSFLTSAFFTLLYSSCSTGTRVLLLSLHVTPWKQYFLRKCCHCSLGGPEWQKWYQDSSFLHLLGICKGIVLFLLFLSKAQEEWTIWVSALLSILSNQPRAAIKHF